MPLPKCTGPFHVGFVDLMTAPKHIPNDLTLQSLCSNETDLGSFSRIYYPCQPPESKVRLSNWLPGKDIYIKSLMKSVGIGWLTPLVKLFTSILFVNFCLQFLLQNSQQFSYSWKNVIESIFSKFTKKLILRLN